MEIDQFLFHPEEEIIKLEIGSMSNNKMAFEWAKNYNVPQNHDCIQENISSIQNRYDLLLFKF